MEETLERRLLQAARQCVGGARCSAETPSELYIFVAARERATFPPRRPRPAHVITAFGSAVRDSVHTATSLNSARKVLLSSRRSLAGRWLAGSSTPPRVVVAAAGGWLAGCWALRGVTGCWLECSFLLAASPVAAAARSPRACLRAVVVGGGGGARSPRVGLRNQRL